ncbi:hypothetical protein E2P81_ATG07299 [Venturia nashicola]|uniref:Secreted protein NIS1 n=1 Tax=Venturia nashicola TaxID=86259 RepID=A0A4Z1NXS2_9PEZI|nr:hypothetical protein E6O75_ATG07459 [Venturia nashicola]TLD31809.1 hypothetical protein E2P81_ATG07299 [Venturia nashicola]
MQFSALALASLLSLASARINGISVPKAIKAGTSIDVILLVGQSQQVITDVAVSFGVVSPVKDAYPGAIGEVIETVYLGPQLSNTAVDIPKSINSFPNKTPLGPVLFTAQVYSLLGRASSGVLATYNVTVFLGDSGSKDRVSSRPV